MLHPMLRISSIILLITLAFSSATHGQFWKIGKKGGTGFKRSTFNPHTSIGFGAGSSHYYSLNDELTMFNRLVNDQSRFNVGAHLTRHVSKNFSIKGNLNYIRLAGNDYTFDNSALLPKTPDLRFRFRNDIVEFGLSGLLELNGNQQSILKRNRFSPYISAGIALVSTNPELYQLDSLGGAGIPGASWRNYADVIASDYPTNPIRNYNETVPSIGFSIPVGVGFRYRLNDFMDFGFEASLRTQLGNLFSAPKNQPAKTELTTKLLIPSEYATNLVDHYFVTQFQLIFHLERSIDCPPIRR
jgi:hypothetical protein